MVYNRHPFNNYMDIKNPVMYWDKIEKNIKTELGFLKQRNNISLHNLISNVIIETPRVKYSTYRFIKLSLFRAEGKVFDFIANISDIVEKSDRLRKDICQSLKTIRDKYLYKDRIFILI
ncbi:hypothetical protein CDIK_3398 [Cucumispora dikerogammari]|nr:hypothetical protein CDIK_3398 [Cucumispora dikerogammari]